MNSSLKVITIKNGGCRGRIEFDSGNMDWLKRTHKVWNQALQIAQTQRYFVVVNVLLYRCLI